MSYFLETLSVLRNYKPLFLLNSLSRNIFHSTKLCMEVTNMSNHNDLVKEGCATVKLPKDVFYNPVQQLNRDLTIAVIRQYEIDFIQYWRNRESKRKKIEDVHPYPGIRILEALAASGLRSTRFCKEIPFVRVAVANDLDATAVELIKENASINGVEKILVPSHSDAIDLMRTHKTLDMKFNVVDLDPYGTVSPFLDSAMQCIHEEGLLCVTSTDMAVLCGSAIGTSMGKYGGIAVKCSAVHEQGLRILLHAIQSAASRHGKIIEPLISLSIDFYARIYCKITSNLGAVKNIATKSSIMYTCTGCYSHYMQPLGVMTDAETNGKNNRMALARGPPVGMQCEECGGHYVVAGPMWNGALHDQLFIDSVLADLHKIKTDTDIKAPEIIDDLKKSQCLEEWFPPPKYGTLTRMIGLLSLAREELPDVPMYFMPDALGSVLKTPLPKTENLRSAILNAGYRVSQSHCQKNAFKTDAPWSFIWEMMRVVRKQERAKLNIKAPADESKETPARLNILSRDLSDKYKIDFTRHEGVDVDWKKKGIIRFEEKPPNWGPGSRARAESPIAKKSKLMPES